MLDIQLEYLTFNWKLDDLVSLMAILALVKTSPGKRTIPLWSMSKRGC